MMIQPIGYNTKGRFDSPELELLFREQDFNKAVSVSRVTMVLVLILNAVYLRNDYGFFGRSSFFYLLLSIRAVFSVSTLIFLLCLKKIKVIRLYDILFSIWIITVCLFMSFVNLTRPAVFFDNYLIDLVCIIGIYSIIHLYLEVQLVSTLIFTLSEIGLILLFKDASGIVRISTLITSFISAHFLGITISLRMKSSLRHSFSLFLNEKGLKEKLQYNLDSVKQLKGLLPICYLCHNIRDDHGYWQKLEKYLRHHSDAEFTHWLCPVCFEKIKQKEAQKSANQF